MANTETKFDWGEALPMVTCPDGTKSIANGIAPPCMGKYGNNKPTTDEVKNPYEVTCKDGTKDVVNGKNPPCIYNGGVKSTTVEYKTATQVEPISDLKYYTSANFLKRASVSIVPVGLIGVYCYKKNLAY